MSGGSAERDGARSEASDHGDDPDLQRALYEGLLSRNGKSCKISAEDARAISRAKPSEKSRKRRRNDECVSSALSKRYGISTKAVRDIWNGRTWATVTGRSTNPAGAVGVDDGGVAGFHGAQGGGRDHGHTGLSRSLRAHNELRMTADTNELAGCWARTGTAGNPMGPALGHNTAADGGRKSSFTPAPFSWAHYAVATRLMLQQNQGPHMHEFSASTANFLAASRVGGDEMGIVYSAPRACPSGAQASASLQNPTSMMRHDQSFRDWAQRLISRSQMPRDRADMKMIMDRPGWSPGPVQWADDRPSDHKPTTPDVMDEGDADFHFPPFTFGQALNNLSDAPLPPEFHMPDDLAGPGKW